MQTPVQAMDVMLIVTGKLGVFDATHEAKVPYHTRRLFTGISCTNTASWMLALFMY